MKTIVISLRRRDLAVLRALPGFLVACTMLFYLTGVVRFYVMAPYYMLAPVGVLLMSWALNMINPMFVLTHEPMDERVRSLLYGIALLVVWAAVPSLHGVLYACGMSEDAADAHTLTVTCVLSGVCHVVVNYLLLRHVAGLTLIPRLGKAPWPFTR